MAARRALFVLCLAAALSVGLSGCLGAPRHPRITWEASGYGDEGGESSFVIDEDGRFRWDSKGDAGNGVIVTERCSGKLERSEVAGLFAQFADASLVDGEVDHEEGQRERGVLTLESEAGQPRSPADRETFNRLAGQIWKLRDRAIATGRCKESRSRP